MAFLSPSGQMFLKLGHDHFFHILSTSLLCSHLILHDSPTTQITEIKRVNIYTYYYRKLPTSVHDLLHNLFPKTCIEVKMHDSQVIDYNMGGWFCSCSLKVHKNPFLWITNKTVIPAVAVRSRVNSTKSNC